VQPTTCFAASSSSARHRPPVKRCARDVRRRHTHIRVC
jgi:hypothetical protein